jgi:hypothetical protein
LRSLNCKGIRESYLEKELRNFIANDYLVFRKEVQQLQWDEVLAEAFKYKSE